MKNVYQNTAFLDKRACEKFVLSNEILMENAANAMQKLIERVTHKGSVITILCGSGDNGGDGYALARHLSGDFHIRIYQVKEPKSPLCKLMEERVNACEIKFVKKLLPCDVVVDCVFGSGFNGIMNKEISDILQQASKIARINIACDMPSGLAIINNQNAEKPPFKADYTICMGAIKLLCLQDMAKDYVGRLEVGNLGLSTADYEINSHIKMLEKADLSLPTRLNANVHKGNFGHLAVFGGEKIGAAILSATSALNFGAGLVSIIESCVQTTYTCPPEIMQTHSLPQNITAISLGMGLGVQNAEAILPTLKEQNCACVLDADVFYAKELKDFLDSTNAPLPTETALIAESNLAREIVLTPHPKEFASLLEICDLSPYKPHNRIDSVLEFTQKYPQITLLLKGSNVYIAKGEEVYINPLGNNALAKGGSGDVLSGLIGALLAQGYNSLQAALQASLAHTIAAENALKNIANYALTPLLLIESVRKLHTFKG